MKTAGVLAAAGLAIAVGAAGGQAAPPSVIVFAADRAPTVTGEVYRLDPNGHRVDLSKSPYQDTNPAVSPDGRRVAFVSNRTDGKPRVYEVGIAGKGLVQVGPTLAPLANGGCEPLLSWRPGSDLLAVGACSNLKGKVRIVQRGHKPIAVRGAGFLMSSTQWSPDGRLLLATSGQTIVAAAATGKTVWTVKGARGWAAWSAQDRAAVLLKGGVGVYDEHGNRQFSVHTGPDITFPAWSGSGGKLAVATGSALVVVGSTGQRIFQKPLAGQRGLVWNGDAKVIVGGFGPCGCHAKSFDIRTGKVSSSSDRWFDTLSADKKLAILTAPRKNGAFSLGAAPPAGGRAKTYGDVPGCWQDMGRQAAIGWQQFAGRSIVYESWGFCDEPYSNLYSVAPGGGKPHRLTNAQADQTQPAFSPDGTEIAYVWAKLTGFSCAGCSDGVRIASSDGIEVRTLTNPQHCTFDDSPTWSPDESTILFSEEGCDVAEELFTMPADGGTPRDLGIAGDEPAWGPSEIAYVDPNKPYGVWTANPDGTNPVRVGDGRHPAWAADGRLAYLHGTTLVVGSTQAQLPFASVSSLAWSPDGTHFVVTARGKNDIALDVFTVKSDGTDPVRLTTNYDVFGATWR